MNDERQVRYNSTRSRQNPEKMEWFFCIVNQNREIIDISNRIYDLLAPIEDEGKTIEGVVTGTGLRYKLLNFETRTRIEPNDFNRIYSRMILDRKLNNRKNPDGLADYLTAQFGD